MTTTAADVIGSEAAYDVILVGDMCYERPLAERLMDWLRASQEKFQSDILLGDPGRSYFPKQGLEQLATYSVATTHRRTGRPRILETGVWRLIR